MALFGKKGYALQAFVISLTCPKLALSCPSLGGSTSGGWRPKAVQTGGDLGGRTVASSRAANGERLTRLDRAILEEIRGVIWGIVL